ncbi:MAG: universal stress protein [Pseudomonadota bacterium]
MKEPESPSNDATNEEAEIPSGSFQHILAVCNLADGDAATLASAAQLASVSGAKLTVLAVVELTFDIDRLFQDATMSREEVERRLVADCRHQIEGLVASTAADQPVSIEIRTGKRFIEIIRQVLAHNHDLVVKTAEELEGLTQHLLASTDQHLLRKCPCALWLRRPTSPTSVKTILAAVAVDEFATSQPPTQTALNHRIIRNAARIATMAQGKLHVLNVWEAPGEGLMRMWSNRGVDESVWRYVAETEARNRRWMDALLDEARHRLRHAGVQDIELVSHLKRGEPRDIIPKQVRALAADTLVIGTIARTGIPGLIIGNTAEDVLNSVEISIVAVKPPGYVSPIRI